jgi:antitoxin MazE
VSAGRRERHGRWILQVGNNLALRIPKSVAQALNLRTGSRVELAIENGALVLRPIVRRERTRVYTIDELLRGMTKENVPQEVDWGEARGNEGW